MLCSPSDLNKVKHLLHLAPLNALLFDGFLLFALGLRHHALVLALLPCVVLLLLLAACAVGFSRYGVRHTFIGASAICFVGVVPIGALSMCLLSPTAPEALTYDRLAVLVGGYAAILACAVRHHLNACPVDWDKVAQGKGQLNWPGTVVQLKNQTLAEASSESELSIRALLCLGAVAGALILYLKYVQDTSLKQAVAAIAGQGLALWLLVSIVGRALAQGYRVGEIEARTGWTFSTDRWPQLEAWRQRTACARWIRKIAELR